MPDLQGIFQAIYDETNHALRISGDVGGGVTAEDVTASVETHADRLAGTATGLGVGGAAAHGAITGTSKLAVLVTPTGTGQFIFVAEESSPPAGVNIGDVWIPAVDGSL